MLTTTGVTNHPKDPPANKALDEDWDGDREDRKADSELGRIKFSCVTVR